MDSLTQAALGGAIGGAVLGSRLGRKAILAGAVLGTLPDLDVLIDFGDAVADYSYHRGFSHSLFVLGGLATLLAALVARLPAARGIGVRRWWLFFTLGLLTHPLLDAFTTYGTQIWWPLDLPPTRWATIFIIDPLYTLPLLVALGVALARGRTRRACAWGLALSGAYLAFTLGAKAVVETRLAPVLAERGLEAVPRLVQPTPFNALLWRVTLIDGDAHHEALVGLLDGETPPRLETFTRGLALEEAALATAAGARLAWFAGPFLRYEARDLEGHPTLVATDLRLGLPGFHPFGFTLARQDAAGWRPIASRLLEPPPRDTGQALERLARRALNGDARLCLSAYVEPRWVVDAACP